jgi:hypothetical protein
VLNPITDAQAERDEETPSLMRQIDARAGEAQPTTS